MNSTKYFIGPVTKNVIDAVIEFNRERNIFGFIPSRRQIDINGGYVGFTTYDFVRYVRDKNPLIVIERDHSGLGQFLPNFPMWMDNRSMMNDAYTMFNIIHLDPWKRFKNYEEGLVETINNIFCLNAYNYNVRYEIGTEEAIRPFSVEEFEKFLCDLKFELGDKLFKNIKYAVIQSGTKLQETKNIGKFDLKKLNDMVEICKSYDILSKEHNGDYLTNDEIKIRFEHGLDSINIAPEFGVLETRILLNYIRDYSQFERIFYICYTGEKWEKWVGADFSPLGRKKELIEICGHYHNEEIKSIVQIDDRIIIDELKKKLEELASLV